MDDAVSRAFSAWPERIYIIDTEASIAYQGGHGPYEFDPRDARRALVELLAQSMP